MRLFAVWEQLLQDLRYALRMMAAQPLFTAVAVLSLALGIGANTAIYSFMDAILVRALPVRNPESLVVLKWRSKDRPAVVHSLSGTNIRDSRTGYSSGNFPFAAYELLRGNSPVFSSLFAFNGAGRLNLLIRGQADLAEGQYVSGDYFGGLGVSPAAGRLIDTSDDHTGARPVVVLSFRYALRRFGEIAGAVHQSILINNTPFTVIGVAAPEFFGVDPGGPQDFYIPMHASLLLDSSSKGNFSRRHESTYYWVEMMGRLRPGITREQAQAALAPAFQRFVEGTAVTDRGRADLPGLYLQPGAGGLDFLRRQYSKPLYILMTMVALILAIACANIANLLLARAAARRREMALRLSLGAARSRMLRQLFTESVALAALGGLLGLAFANWGIRALTVVLGNGRENFGVQADLNWRVLTVTVASSLATGLLFGLAPALQSLRVDLNGALRQIRVGEDRLRLSTWFRVSPSQALMVSQIALSLLLLVAAGLFVRTLTNLNAVILGFNSERILLFTVNANQTGHRDGGLVRFYQDLQERLSAMPGVLSVSSSNFALVSGSGSSREVKIAGFAGKNRESSVLKVGPSFFTTMQIPILRGREIDHRDVQQGASVAVINEVFAKAYFGGENPVGQHFGLGGSEQVDFEIIGVAKAAPYRSLKDRIAPVAYVPYSQNPRTLTSMVYELRTASDPLSLVQSLRQLVTQADARVPVTNIVTHADQIDQTVSQERMFATLCSCFALLAVLIACVGLYGTMAYSVARRTNEIGIRMALGAERRRVIWMVLREVLGIAASASQSDCPRLLPYHALSRASYS